jgi:hypothetical protein
MKCSRCGRELPGGKQGARQASICGSVMGDEYIESYYYCEQCLVYTREIYHDRFAGDDTVSVQGPIEKSKGEDLIAVIRRCPDPMNKRCRCEAHMEYFGTALD